MGKAPAPILRPGQPADAENLARLHVSVWRETYRHIAPPEAVLSVVRDNRDARRFYAAMGGRETGRFTDPGPPWRSENIVVSWRFSTPSEAAGP
ncbi:MAG: hypothetical protein N4A39_05170 [Roseicyclus sp.]|jgi:hypothetical protein|nr:hypothetical protein [Roseicyclus sp.]